MEWVRPPIIMMPNIYRPDDRTLEQLGAMLISEDASQRTDALEEINDRNPEWLRQYGLKSFAELAEMIRKGGTLKILAMFELITRHRANMNRRDY